MKSRCSTLSAACVEDGDAMKRAILILLSALFISTSALAQTARTLDLAEDPVSRLEPSMTSLNIAIHGIRLGMTWDQARDILTRKEVPYLFSKSLPLTVYIPPSNPSFYLTLHPSSYEVFEMGVMGTSKLPLENRYIANGNHWRLTTARTFFFGSEGHDFLNEEARSFMYERLGFALKWLLNGEFCFVLFYPEGWTPPRPQPPQFVTPKPYRSTIPFFVTGYYYPNTSLNYRWLLQRKNAGELKDAHYIDLNDEDYETLARSVDREMDRVFEYIQSNLQVLNASGRRDIAMYGAVYGFVDPRGLTPGKYIDSTIVNEVIEIRQGELLEGESGNSKLATLRAYHTRNMIDAFMMEKSPLYRQLKQERRILWKAMGRGVPITERTHREMRSIEIEIRFEKY